MKNEQDSAQPAISASFEVESVAFEGPKTPDRGYTIRASYLKEPHKKDALIEVIKNGQVIRCFTFPAYKIHNLQAHFRDIVDSEIENSAKGYEMAMWDGISGAVFLIPNGGFLTAGDNHDQRTIQQRSGGEACFEPVSRDIGGYGNDT